MSNSVRVFFRIVDNEADDPGDQYLIELLVDDQMKPVKGRVFFGVWGPIGAADDRFPIILLSDGDIDLGEGTDTDSYVRYQRTNILERTMKVGEMVTFSFADAEQPSAYDDYTYRIERVTPIT